MKRWSMPLGGVIMMALVLVFLCSVSFASGGPRAPDTMIQQSIDDVDVTFGNQIDGVEPGSHVIACNQCRFVPVGASAATASPAEVGVRVGIKSRSSPEGSDERTAGKAKGSTLQVAVLERGGVVDLPACTGAGDIFRGIDLDAIIEEAASRTDTLL